MSSQASSAGHADAEIRRKLIESGDVDVVISIRSNFFYTRTVPCELWHFDRGKPDDRRDQVLMIDARNIYRKITRKIYDFSQEQLQNITAIVWLYRGQSDRFIALFQSYLDRTIAEASAIAEKTGNYRTAFEALTAASELFMKTLPKDSPLHDRISERDEAAKACFLSLNTLVARIAGEWNKPCTPEPEAQKKLLSEFDTLATISRNIVKDVDIVFKLAARLVDAAEMDSEARKHDAWDNRAIGRLQKELEIRRKDLVEQLKAVAYFERQAHWLLVRFPDARLVQVPGLVKLVNRKEIEASDWSLTPGRYVGVAPPEVDNDFDFEQTLRDIHTELIDLNQEAVTLAEKIQKNFGELGI